MSDVSAFRHFYARYITRCAGVNNARIVDAFAAVERERFLGPGPRYQEHATTARKDDTGRVRSLRREGTPDESAWCVGADWWLSTAEPGE